MKRAALYLRSSKDRSDVSIDAQRRALKDLAKARGLTVAAEFADAVESGKDDDRPGFQRLLASIRDSRRGWDTVLVHDTSRIARRRHIAFFFEDACRKAGISVLYKNMPESDPVTDTLLRGIMQALDEWHSLTSKQKGLSGMAENVRQGYRAGGRAPLGYRLKKVTTGAIRDGAPVTKSVLELDPEVAPKVAAYLQARAGGMQAKMAAEQAGLADVPSATRVGLEWNALTYAGHTVWNVNAEREGGQYVGGSKRRPRSEWVIQRDTHPAMIDDNAAELLLARLEALGGQRNAGARAQGRTLLSGLLVDRAGAAWRSEGAEYRHRGARRSIKSETIEDAVLGQVYDDLASPALAKELVARLRRTLESNGDVQARAALVRSETDLRKRIHRQMELAEQMTNPAPALRMIEELEGKCAELALEIARLDRELDDTRAAEAITEAGVQRLLRGIVADRGDDARGLLLSLVEKVELDPDTMTGSVHYRLAVSGDEMASPRRGEQVTGLAIRATIPLRYLHRERRNARLVDRDAAGARRGH